MSAGGEDPELELDLLAASLRADAGDLRGFVEGLAAKLEASLPSAVQVQRRREGLLGPKRVRSIAVDLGGRRLELSFDGARVQTSCSQLSGGIVLKREPATTEAWLRLLEESLRAEAEQSASMRQALERLLTG